MKTRISGLMAFVAVALACMHCGGAPEGEELAEAENALSSRMATRYGITVFGGAGDYQALACGGHSRTYQTSMPWYAANSQRYGCKAHVKLIAANGKCVVVSTEDAGPATFVENKAGVAVFDVGPAVARHLFGTTSIGWSDIKKNGNKYVVNAERTTLPVGPCNASSGNAPLPNNPPADPDDDEPPPNNGGGIACTSDGICNPGNDGSGQICVNGRCVDGCRSNAQCPGVKTCIGGQCR